MHGPLNVKLVSSRLLVCVSVRPSVRMKHCVPIGLIFVKFHVLDFYKNLSMNSDFG